MRLRRGSIAAIGAACLLATFGNVAYSQTVKLNCQGIDSECLMSEQPVQGVRIVRQSNFPTRPAFYLSSNLYTTLAAARETLNKFVAFDFVIPPGGGPLPHTHRNEWETFFVESGTVTFTIGVEPTQPFNFITKDVSAGTVIYGPQGPVHGFVNNSGKPARIFSFAMPSGLDSFFHNSGTSVADWNAPIPPITLDEIFRTAFWAEQRGDALYPPNTPAPPVPATTPDHVIGTIGDPARPTKTGPFGEKRVVLLTPKEVGNITAAEAFCGPPPIPGRPGGTVEYSFISLPPTGFGADYVSPNTEVFMTLGGNLSLRVTGPAGGNNGNGNGNGNGGAGNGNGNGNQTTQTKIVTLEPLSFVQIDPGVAFSIANLSSTNIHPGFPTNSPGQVGGDAQTLAVTVFGPQDKNYPLTGQCPPSPFGN
jgi:mannose-6-phosphate isomerase-like protein (cupin superfamily)